MPRHNGHTKRRSKEISREILRLVTEEGIPQATVARRLSVSRQYVSQLVVAKKKLQPKPGAYVDISALIDKLKVMGWTAEDVWIGLNETPSYRTIKYWFAGRRAKTDHAFALAALCGRAWHALKDPPKSVNLDNRYKVFRLGSDIEDIDTEGTVYFRCRSENSHD